MDNKRVKFLFKIFFSRFGKIIRKPQGVKFFGAPCKSTVVVQVHMCLGARVLHRLSAVKCNF